MAGHRLPGWLGVWPLSAELTAAAHDVERGLLASLGLGTVAVSWSTVHTTFTLRYATLDYTGPRAGTDRPWAAIAAGAQANRSG